MKVALVTPWNNAWIPLYEHEFRKRGHDFTLLRKPESGYDLVLHGWAVTPAVRGARNITFLRRYELFSGALTRTDWHQFEKVICVNSWIRDVLESHVKRHVHLIYNAASKHWIFRDREPNNKIGMACHIHPKKNIPLALQILSEIPAYELHIAGEIQDPCTAEYIREYAVRKNLGVYLYGHVDNLDKWWADKSFVLSTSISEGNPNNVIEAMAKGIKPIVHNWPGAEDQFPEDLRFHDIQDALRIVHGPYDSFRYRGIVEEKYSLKNIERVVDICESVS